MSYLNSCSDIDPRDFRGFVDLSATAAIRGAPPGGIYTLRELLQFVVAASWEKPMAENWNAVTTLRSVASAMEGFGTATLFVYARVAHLPPRFPRQLYVGTADQRHLVILAVRRRRNRGQPVLGHAGLRVRRRAAIEPPGRARETV